MVDCPINATKTGTGEVISKLVCVIKDDSSATGEPNNMRWHCADQNGVDQAIFTDETATSDCPSLVNAAKIDLGYSGYAVASPRHARRH